MGIYDFYFWSIVALAILTHVGFWILDKRFRQYNNKEAMFNQIVNGIVTIPGVFLAFCLFIM